MSTGGKRRKRLPLTRALWWPVGGLVLLTCVHGHLKGHHCPCLDTEKTGWNFMCHLHPLSVHPAQTGFMVYSQSTEQWLCHQSTRISWAKAHLSPSALPCWAALRGVMWGHGMGRHPMSWWSATNSVTRSPIDTARAQHAGGTSIYL